MKGLAPAAAVFVIGALIALIIHQPALIVLALIVSIGMAALTSGRQAQARASENSVDDLPPEERTLLRPVKKAYQDLQQVVEENKTSTTVQVLGKEAVSEAGRIYEQATKSLRLRSELRRSLRGKFEAETEIGRLQSQASTGSEAEREAYLSAAEARKTELGHYSIIEENVSRIDAGLRQAQAALAEIKARLSVGASGEKMASNTDADLRESLGRLKSISLSYDEAEQLLND